MKAKPAQFRVDPRLTRLLGESYRSTEQAIKELIDNAWDADSEHVWITLPAPLTNDPIVIPDDGTGMTEREVRQAYLNIANDQRTRKGEFTLLKRRAVNGRKGIGKFAGLVAAEVMEVSTVCRGSSTRIRIVKEDVLRAQRGGFAVSNRWLRGVKPRWLRGVKPGFWFFDCHRWGRLGRSVSPRNPTRTHLPDEPSLTEEIPAPSTIPSPSAGKAVKTRRGGQQLPDPHWTTTAYR
jgi:hypothetical protein